MKKLALVCLVFLVSAGCLSTCGSPQRPAYLKARAQWEAQGIRHYRFDYKIGCNCPWYGMMPLKVEVQDGEIVAMAASNGGDISPYQETFNKHATIERLFDLLDSSTSHSLYRLEVQYDPTYGFPASIVIDPYKNITDDATGYNVTNFEVLP